MGGVLVVLINRLPGTTWKPKYGWNPGSVVCVHSVWSRSLLVGFCSIISTEYRVNTHHTTRTPPIFGFRGGPWTIVDQHYQDCTHIWYPGGPWTIVDQHYQDSTHIWYPGGPWTIVDQHYQDSTHIWVSRRSLTIVDQH